MAYDDKGLFLIHITCQLQDSCSSAPCVFFIQAPRLRDQPRLGTFHFHGRRKKKQWFLKLLLRHREYCPAAYIPLAKAIHMAKAAASEVGIYSCHGGGGPVEGEVL